VKRWSIFLFALATLTIASSVCADPLKDPLPWVGPQILSAINKHNVWTPTDFAIARGDSVNSLPKIQVAKDVLQKSGVTLPDILKTILIWSK
tara:strand:- start:191 stop:466 length:276 start_codon:yes stop_codon:yes gene_type:complete